MRIAITGASGLIGSALSARLAVEDHEVLPFDEFDTQRSEPVGRVVGGGDLRLHGLDAAPHSLQIDRCFSGGHAEAVCLANRVSDPRAGDQRLGRHAAGPQAIATDAAALDGGHLEPQLSGCELGSQRAARTEADDDEVVLMSHAEGTAFSQE